MRFHDVELINLNPEERPPMIMGSLEG